MKRLLVIAILCVAIAMLGFYVADSIATTPAPRTITGGPGVPTCGQDQVSHVVSPQITLTQGNTANLECLDFVYTNTSNETLYPGFATITVKNSAGVEVFNATLADAVAMNSGLAPGNSWEGAAYWNVSPSAAFGDTMSVSIQITSLGATTSVTAATPIS